MSKWTNPFKVGLLVIAGIAASLVTMTKLTSDGVDTASYIRVYAMFDDVTGLAPKSRVRMSGIAIGEIDKIELKGRQARVDILVRKDIVLKQGVQSPTKPDYFKNGATVSKKQASFIGDSYLEIAPGEEGPVLSADSKIPNVNEGVALDKVFEKLNKITSDIESVTSALSAVLGGDKGAKSIEQILTDLKEILATVNAFVADNSRTVGAIVADAKAISSNVRDFSRTGTQSVEEILADSKSVVRDAKAIVQEVRFVVGQSSDDIQAGIGSISSTIVRLQSTLDSLNYSLQNIQDITDKVNEGEGTIGALVNDPAIAQRTDAILADAQSITGPLAQLRTIVELRSEYHFLSSQFKNFLGIRLQPNPNKYYLLQIVDDFRGTPSFVTETVRNPETGNVEVRETRTVTDDLKFSFVFANTAQVTSWLAVTGRFGLIESTGGVGGNLLLFDDRRLDIQADLFDFQFNDSPRLRMFATYHLLPYIYASAGFDDIFNSNSQSQQGRNLFMGFGIQFTDEDLKSLITATGVPSP